MRSCKVFGVALAAVVAMGEAGGVHAQPAPRGTDLAQRVDARVD